MLINWTIKNPAHVSDGCIETSDGWNSEMETYYQERKKRIYGALFATKTSETCLKW